MDLANTHCSSQSIEQVQVSRFDSECCLYVRMCVRPVIVYVLCMSVCVYVLYPCTCLYILYLSNSMVVLFSPTLTRAA